MRSGLGTALSRAARATWAFFAGAWAAAWAGAGTVAASRGRAAISLLVAVGLAGCGTANFDLGGPAPDEGVYAAIFPYFAELCAVSQYRKRPGYGLADEGGIGGHAVLYLNGACLEQEGAYPVLRLCGGAGADPDEGVGISANAHFRNANWVGVQGRHFLFDGDLHPGERLDGAAFRRTLEVAKRKGFYDAIRFHEEAYAGKPVAMARRDYKYEISIATDYAIAFGRGRYCARVPVSGPQMGRMVDYLNGRNALYRDGRRAFVWNVFRDNCSHLLRNALAAAGVWEERRPGRSIAVALFDFPVPKNEFVNLARRTNDMPLADLGRIYADGAARRALMRDGFIATEPGAIVGAVPVWQPNDVYDTAGLKLIFYDDPMLGGYAGRFDRIFGDPRYFDLRDNLERFDALSRDLIRQRHSAAWWEARRGAAGPDPAFRAFYDRFYATISGMRARTDAALARLNPAPPRAASMASALQDGR